MILTLYLLIDTSDVELDLCDTFFYCLCCYNYCLYIIIIASILFIHYLEDNGSLGFLIILFLLSTQNKQKQRLLA